MGYRIIHRGKMVKEITMKEIAEMNTAQVVFLLIFNTQANAGDFTMADNAVFPVVLTVISFAFAVLSMYHVERKDLIG